MTLIGRIDDSQMLEHLAQCRAVCFPPYDEDYGFVTAEAFASRKPVVTCSDSGGPAELVIDDVSGKVCAPRPEALARALRELMDDAAAAERMGQAGTGAGIRDDMAPRGQTAVDGMTTKPGLIASALVGFLLLAFALSVDFPKANGDRFKGDESTYYMLAHSLARDFDFQYQRKDLIRVWEEFSGPEGVFLKTGKDVDIRGSSSFPFFQWLKREDAERETRLYFSKSYIYPLVAAPFMLLFGTNGFLVLHAILIAFDLLVIYLFVLAATKSNWVALPMAIAFLAASVVPVYFVWLTPELFNFSVLLYAVFFWAYKEVANSAPCTHRTYRTHRTPPRAGVGLRRGPAGRAGYVLKTAASAGPGTDDSPRGEPPPVEARGWHPRHLWNRHRCAVRAERRHYRRVQLSRRRSKDLLLVHGLSVREYLGDIRQHRTRARARGPDGWRCAREHSHRHGASP